MYYSDKTYEKIKQKVLSRISLPIDKREGSFINDMVSPYCLELEDFYAEFPYLLGTMFLVDADRIELEKRGEEYGITRKKSLKATGFINIAAKNGDIKLKAGENVSTESGLIYSIDKDVIASANETLVPVTAQSEGAKYNVESNTITKFTKSKPDLIITNKAPISGGADEETDQELLGRIYYKLRNPSTGGNIHDFRNWALEVEGVGDAKVFPLWAGNGTVKIIAIDSNKRAVGVNTLQRIKDNIEKKKPIFGEVTVSAPSEIDINVDAKIKLESGYKLENINEEFCNLLKSYIKETIFKKYSIDYYRILSFFYDVSGVAEVIEIKLNGGTLNVKIEQDSIQKMGKVNIVGI